MIVRPAGSGRSTEVPDRERIDRSGKSALRQCLRAVHQHIHDGSELLIVHQQVDLLLRQDQPQLLPASPVLTSTRSTPSALAPDHHLDRADVIGAIRPIRWPGSTPCRQQRDRSPHATVEELGIGRGPRAWSITAIRCGAPGRPGAPRRPRATSPGRERCQLTDEAVRQVRW